MTTDRPKLVLLGGGRITAADVAKMFEALTGREAGLTLDEHDRLDRQLARAYDRLERKDDGEEGKG
jgi:hypothetical protein